VAESKCCSSRRNVADGDRMTPRQWTCVRSQYVYLPTVFQLLLSSYHLSLLNGRVAVLASATVTWRTWLRLCARNLLSSCKFEVGYVPALSNLMIRNHHLLSVQSIIFGSAKLNYLSLGYMMNYRRIH